MLSWGSDGEGNLLHKSSIFQEHFVDSSQPEQDRACTAHTQPADDSYCLKRSQ